MAGRYLNWEDELGRWLKPFLDRLGHKARRRMCPLYVAGLIGPGDRKSVQPMAERLAPGDYDQLHHFVSAGVWDAAPLETELLIQADRLVGGGDAVLVIDDTAVPKKGMHSVGVAAQYASVLGKTANCQTLVSLTLARGEVPVMVALRLFASADMGQRSAASSGRRGLAHRRATPVGREKDYLANLPAEMDLRDLAAKIKARWICEQAHQQLKEELGLDHFEGRSWHGLHRHALMTMIAYAFLQHRRLTKVRRGKRILGPPLQPSLPAVRHAIIALIARSPPQRCPHCRKWICSGQRRE